MYFLDPAVAVATVAERARPVAAFAAGALLASRVYSHMQNHAPFELVRWLLAAHPRKVVGGRNAMQDHLRSAQNLLELRDLDMAAARRNEGLDFARKAARVPHERRSVAMARGMPSLRSVPAHIFGGLR